MRTRVGFTLVELMIVVAIVGILAAIAIPNYRSMQLRAKRSELPGTLNAIKTAETGYYQVDSTYLAASHNPASPPSQAPRAWDTLAEWTELGWRPDGLVRGTYEVTTARGNDFTATGTSDIDGDGILATYTTTANTDATLRAGDENTF